MISILYWLIPAISLVFSASEEKAITELPKPVYMSSSKDPSIDAQWKTIDSLESRRLYKSANELLSKLIEELNENEHPFELVKAYHYKAKYLTFLNEEEAAISTRFMEEKLKSSNSPIKEMLYNGLAKFYYSYLNSNWYEIKDRTSIARDSTGDFNNWTAEELISISNEYYLKSASNTALKSISLDELTAIAQKGEYAGNLITNLYELLLHDAIIHFSSPFTLLGEPVNAFSLDNIAYLEDYRTFLSTSIQSDDSLSFTFRALQLYQTTIKHYNSAERKDALLYFDLQRLEFVRQHSGIESKDSQYAGTLEKYQREFADSPLWTEVVYKLAQIKVAEAAQYQPLNEESHIHRFKLLDAIKLCEQAISKFPESVGAASCKQLISQIKATWYTFTFESQYIPDQPILAFVQFKNMDSLPVKLHSISMEQMESLQQMNYEKRDAFINALPVYRSWNQNLPKTETDHQTHSVEIPIDPLPSGLYLIKSKKHTPNKYGQADYEIINVSGLSMITRQTSRNTTDVWVVDALGGCGVKGAEVNVYRWDYSSGKSIKKKIHTAYTDKDGNVKLSSDGNGNTEIRVRHKKDVLLPVSYYGHFYENSRHRTYTQLFTDRSIYRPGQVVYFKGIALDFDEQSRPSIISNKKLTVRLLDVNYQEVSKKNFVSNEFGSINGEFVLPVSGLTGSFTLEVAEDRSTHQIQVEEYKRPKFEVTFEPVDGKVAIGELITVRGKATMLNGVPVDNAAARYRVVRRVSYPYAPWWYYRGFYDDSPEAQIANGALTTDASGNFEIEFVAKAPVNSSNRLIPVYNFEIKVDVTDAAGETRQGVNNIQISKLDRLPSISTSAKIEKDDWKKIHFNITNSQYVRQNAQGTLTITRLESPEVYIKSRKWERPDLFLLSETEFKKKFPHNPYTDEDQAASWKKEEVVLNNTVNPTISDSLLFDTKSWKTGMYEVKLVTQTSSGQPVETIQLVEVFSLKDKEPHSNTALWVYSTPSETQPVSTVHYYLNTNLPGKRAFVTVEKLGKVYLEKWVELNNLVRIDIPVELLDKGDFYVHAFIAGLNETYVSSHRISVPWTEKQLDIEWLSKRDKLLPGSQEEWTLKISGRQKDAIVAEVLASMYDASLDLFTPHYWESIPFPSNSMKLGFNPSAQGRDVKSLRSSSEVAELSLHRRLPYLLSFGWDPYRQRINVRYSRAGGEEKMMMKDGDMVVAESAPIANDEIMSNDAVAPEENSSNSATEADLSPRTNLKETVFFFPELRTDEEGNVILSFTMNEALTKWKFMLFAHTKDMASGQFQATVQTQKDLMVFPNVPRFVRQLDTIDLSMKVSNLIDSDISGEATLSLIDEVTGKDLNSWIQGPKTLAFQSKSLQSSGLIWKVAVPSDFVGTLGLTYKAKSGQHTDAEVHTIPVLTNRMMVTESLSLWVNGKSEKMFTWAGMQDNLKSPSLRHHQYTLEFTSNPAWYAVQAMPYIMEYPYDCTEQVLSRYYANSLSSAVLAKYPAIKKVFDNWASKGLLQSNLSKNQELKTALLAETPWVLNAISEEQQQKNIALLFDLNRMRQEESAAIKKLTDRQLGDGGFAWFDGGRSNWYVTQYLIETLGHMDKLGVKDVRASGEIRNMLTRALTFCDAQFLKYYEEVQARIKRKEAKPEDNHLSYMVIHYLYARTFFTDFPLNSEVRKAVEFFHNQEEKFWTKQNDYSQGMIALTLHRNLNKSAANLITKSLKERLLHKEELGSYLKTTRGYFWYQAPIETHTMLMEVMAEIQPSDTQLMSELKRWLLKQKQTSHWPTTKSTANAVYALLMTGDNWLQETAPVGIQISGKVWEADEHSVVAGSGYVKTKLDQSEFMASNPTIQLNNPNNQPAWGAVYWQYFEDMDKINNFQETPLTIKKQVFRKNTDSRGSRLSEITEGNTIRVGDVLTVRIELKVDRHMEFLHMKDMRASGLEPMETLSSYKWKGGLGYYQSIRDTGVDFFFDYISPGTYIFEYDLRAFHSGNGSNGITSIQCMYAPEFTSHTKGIRMNILPN